MATRAQGQSPLWPEDTLQILCLRGCWWWDRQKTAKFQLRNKTEGPGRQASPCPPLALLHSCLLPGGNFFKPCPSSLAHPGGLSSQCNLCLIPLVTASEEARPLWALCPQPGPCSPSQAKAGACPLLAPLAHVHTPVALGFSEYLTCSRRPGLGWPQGSCLQGAMPEPPGPGALSLHATPLLGFLARLRSC